MDRAAWWATAHRDRKESDTTEATYHTHIGTSLVWPWGVKEWVGYFLFVCSSMNLKDLVFKTNQSYLIIIYFPVFLINHM